MHGRAIAEVAVEAVSSLDAELVCPGVCVHVCMCVCEREREREIVSVCVNVFNMYNYIQERLLLPHNLRLRSRVKLYPSITCSPP